MSRSRPSTVKLFLTGDVMTGRGIDQIRPTSCPPGLHEPYVRSARTYVDLAERAHGPVPRNVAPEYVWGDLLDTLSVDEPDLRIVNLETSVTTSECWEPKGINYRMHPDNTDVLGAAEIDCAVLANNHVLDWGVDGLLDTLRHLREAEVATAGAGTSRDRAEAPAVLDAGDGGRVLVFAMALPDSGTPTSWAAGPDLPGVWVLPDASPGSVLDVRRVVEAYRRKGDVVVASMHWGDNWGYEIPETHQRLARGLIESAGVDVVHGHSSHHPKGFEVHRGRLILYGCGDFLNDYEGITGKEEYRGDLVVGWLPLLERGTGRLVRLDLIPFRTRHLRLERPPADDVAWLHQRLAREVRRLGGAEPRRIGDRLVVEPELEEAGARGPGGHRERGERPGS